MFILVLELVTLIFIPAHAYVIITSRAQRRKNPSGRLKRSQWVLISVCSAMDTFVVGIICFLLVVERYDMKRPAIAALGLLGASMVALMIYILSWSWKRVRFRRIILPCAACLALLTGYTAADKMYYDYIQSITVGDYFNYRTYAPFQRDSLAARLDEPASLRFSPGDDLPVMDGATALYPVYAAFAQATYPEVLADWEEGDVLDLVRCSTTEYAYRSIIDGECDIIFAAGPSKAQEAAAADKGVKLVYTPIGREAFVFYVHPDNPIEGLTLDQLRGIYKGDITRWDQLGVRGLGRILAYQREKNSGSQTALERLVMKGEPLMKPPTEVYSDMGAIIEAVSDYQNHKNALGYSFRFYCTRLMEGFNVKLLSVDGVPPAREHIEDGAYPLASSFYAVTREDADENTRALLGWIQGAEGQALIEKVGYTSVGVTDGGAKEE